MQWLKKILLFVMFLLLRKIIIKQVNDVVKSNILTLFVASCFGIMRFAVEAEAYIIPIFLSLSASFFFYQFLINKKIANVFLSGIFISAACLFHQIHLFWGIGLFMGFLTTRKFKNLLMFTLPTPLVLVVYSWVLVDYNHTAFSIDHLFHFLAQYYFTDQGKVMIPLLSKLTVTAITFVRTFFQVHGTVLETLRMFRVTYLVVVLTVCLVIWSMIRIVKRFKLNSLHSVSQFEILHLGIFIFQLGFAVFSYGNSEFMVMLPFLIAIFMSGFFKIEPRAVYILSLGMLIWNMTFAILPNHFVDYQNNDTLIKLIQKEKDKVFITKEPYLIVNQYYYYFGEYNCSRIINHEDSVAIRKYKKLHATFYTDILSKKVAYNRVDFTENLKYNDLLYIRHIQWIPSAMGGFWIDEVKIK